VVQGQFAAFDPEPLEEDDELVDGDEEEEDDDEVEEDEDSVEDLLGVEPLDDPLLEALSLAVAAFRLSVR
jgi:hypothetical protein